MIPNATSWLREISVPRNIINKLSKVFVLTLLMRRGNIIWVLWRHRIHFVLKFLQRRWHGRVVDLCLQYLLARIEKYILKKKHLQKSTNLQKYIIDGLTGTFLIYLSCLVYNLVIFRLRIAMFMCTIMPNENRYNICKYMCKIKCKINQSK